MEWKDRFFKIFRIPFRLFNPLGQKGEEKIRLWPRRTQLEIFSSIQEFNLEERQRSENGRYGRVIQSDINPSNYNFLLRRGLKSTPIPRSIYSIQFFQTFSLDEKNILLLYHSNRLNTRENESVRNSGKHNFSLKFNKYFHVTFSLSRVLQILIFPWIKRVKKEKKTNLITRIESVEKKRCQENFYLY